MEAMKRAMNAFNGTSQQRPHLTLLYDYDGASYKKTVSTTNETIANHLLKDLKLNLSWTASYLHVAYTPLRIQWHNSSDMRNIVSKWKVEASIKLQSK